MPIAETDSSPAATAEPATIAIDFAAAAQAEEDAPSQQGLEDLQIVEGNAVKLKWSVAAEDGYDVAVEIASEPDGQGPGASSAEGTFDVSPSTAVAFTLTAKATRKGVDAGQKKAVVTVHTHARGVPLSPITQVRAAQRPKVTLSASSDGGAKAADGVLRVPANETITLRWKVDGAADDLALDPNPLGQPIAAEGDLVVTVGAEDQTFTLTATNGAGEDAQALTVLVA